MPEEFLDDPEVGASIKQVGRERMPKGMRRDAFREAGDPAQPVDAEPEAAHPDGLAAMVQEDLGRIRADPTALRQKHAAPFFQVGGKRAPGRPAEQPDALLSALAEHADIPAPKVERPEVRGSQLADPQAGGIRGLDRRPVAQRERHGEAGAAMFGVDELPVDGRHEPIHLVDLEYARQPSRQPGRRDRPPWVTRGQAIARCETVEGPDGREALCDR